MREKEIIHMALAEDLGKLKDITSRGIFDEKSQSRAIIIAKESGVISGIPVVADVFHALDKSLKLRPLVKDGDEVSKSTELFVIEGKTISILEGERVSLNFLGHLSGIASTVHKFVQALKGTAVRVLDTRKTTPGLRDLEKKAVRAGGGINHRMGLYDRVLIKDNHIKARGGITAAVESIRSSYGDDFFIEVEASDLAEVEEALHCQVDQILLDNMDTPSLREAVILVDKRIPLEASGNITLDNARAIAETSVDYISVGSITHSARALDLSLKMSENK